MIACDLTLLKNYQPFYYHCNEIRPVRCGTLGSGSAYTWPWVLLVIFLLVSSACAVALLICIGVRSCGWLSSMSIWRIKTAVNALMKKGTQFCLRCRWHDCSNYLQNIEDSTIVEGYAILFGHEHLSIHVTVGFGSRWVQCIAVNCKDHVASAVGEYCILLCCHVIQELFTLLHCFLHWVCLFRSKWAEHW